MRACSALISQLNSGAHLLVGTLPCGARNIVAVGLLCFGLNVGVAQADDINANTWSAIAKLPDLGGSWLYDMHRTQVAGNDPIPLTPAFAKRMAEIHKVNIGGGDVPARAYHCMPRGVPEVMELVTRLYEFVVTPGLVTIIPQNNEVRFVYTDGRAHPTNLKPTYNGHSIGHWEETGGAKTLIIDSVGMAAGHDMFYGFPSGGPMHVTERLRLIAPSKLEIGKTIEDPVTLTEPYSYARTYTRHREWTVLEEICLQNNRDLSDAGRQQFDLTPPPELKK